MFDVPATAFDTGGPPGWGPSAGQAKAFSLAPLWRYKWSILAIFILVAGAAIPAIWTLPTFLPKYTAHGVVQVRPIIPTFVFKTPESGPIPLYDSYLNSQVGIIRSPRVLQRVLEDNRSEDSVQNTEWYRDKPLPLMGAGKTPLERLLDDLEVRPRGRTEFIDIEVSTYKARDAAIIVNAVLDHYLGIVRELSDETRQQLYRDLVKEDQELRSDIEARERVVATLRRELGAGTPEEMIAQARTRLNAAGDAMEQLERDIAAAEWEEHELWRLVRLDPAAATSLHESLTEAVRVLDEEIKALSPAPETADAGAAPDAPSVAAADTEAGADADADAAVPAEAQEPVDTATEASEAQLAALRDERAKLDARRKELALILRPKSEDPGEEAPAEVAPATPVVDPRTDGEWQRLNAQHQSARIDVEVARERLQDSHPEMIALQRRVTFTAELIRERERQLSEEAAQAADQAVNLPGQRFRRGETRTPQAVPEIVGQLQAARQRVKQLKRQESLRREDVSRAEAGLAKTFESAQTLAKEADTIRHKRELYTAVRTRLDQMEMQRNVPGSIEVLTRAFAPSEPSKDRRLMLTGMALAGALAAGVAQAFLRGNTPQAIKTRAMERVITESDELVTGLQTPFLGDLPLLPDDAEHPVEASPLLVEPVRMVRTALLQRLGGRRGSVVQVTSACPGVGKSTVAILLGRSLAQCGKKVLLVDADLKHPALADRFGCAAEPGFIGALVRSAADSQAILATDTPGLSLLPSGVPRSGMDHELITNGVLKACLERWRDEYDIVLLDSSPVLPVADARILAQRADGTILVVREKACRRSEVVEALALLEVCGGKLLGAVFVGAGRGGRYGSSHYYGKYAGYYNHNGNDKA
jgi:capsular exopolysaccharide synthesis family protein